MKRFVGTLAVLGVLVLAWLAWDALGRPFPDIGSDPPTGGVTDPGSDPAPEPPASGDVPARPDTAFPLTVGYVYDGDTIKATMVTPNDIVTTANPIKIRIIGINTPEGTPEVECWANEARSALSQLLPEGATVWAAPDRDTWDDYGRRLFNLWTDDGRFVDYEMVASGAAEAIRVWPNVTHYDLLAAAQDRAEQDRLGQWGACG